MMANRPYPRIAALTAILSLAACASEPKPTPPAPRPVPVSRPAPPLPAPTAPSTWRDAPISAGTWRWDGSNGQSWAVFGDGTGARLTMTCQRSTGQVEIARAGTVDRPIAMNFFTTSVNRTFTGQAKAGASPSIAATLRAGDPFLDALAFSRGRFALEMAGLPTLYVPSWPEISRVIEDCR